MEKQALYKNLASYYDRLYSKKDYEGEAARIEKLVRECKESSGKELLEIACGTGGHIQYFKDSFSVLATDVSKEMLAIARKKFKDVAFKQADMVNLNLGRKFDVIVCLFSSIGYVKTLGNLKKTVNNFSHHLKKGGTVFIEPWSTRDGAPHMATYNSRDIKIARLSVSKIRGKASTLDMHYLVAERNRNTKHFIDRHELGMFGVQETLTLMERAGLRAKFVRNGLGNEQDLYIGVKE